MLVAAESFLAGNKKLSYVFKTNASGGIDELPEKETHAYNLIEMMAFTCGGISIDFLNEAFPEVEAIAIEMGRSIMRHKTGNDYFTTISPSVDP